MLRRIGARLSYANVMATVAMFIALGGTGYAATQLPGSSTAGAAKKHRKHKKHKKAANDTAADTSLFGGLLSTAAGNLSVASARSATTAGTASNANNLGGSPPGAYQSRIRWAYVHADGTIGAQSGGFSLTNHGATGGYYLDTGGPAAGRSITATLHEDQTGTHAGYISVAACGNPSTSGTGDNNGAIACGFGNDGNHVYVLVFDSSTIAADEGFYIQITG